MLGLRNLIKNIFILSHRNCRNCQKKKSICRRVLRGGEKRKKLNTLQIVTLNPTPAHAAAELSVATAAAQTAKNTEASISTQIKIDLKMLSLNLVQKLIQNKCILGIGCIQQLVIFSISSGYRVKEVSTTKVLKNIVNHRAEVGRTNGNKW